MLSANSTNTSYPSGVNAVQLEISHFCKASPPTQAEFLEIARSICGALPSFSEFELTYDEPIVEPNAWVTAIVLGGMESAPISQLSVYGTFSFVIRDAEPKAGATLLLFSHGKRITQGKLSILEAEYDVKNGSWLPFAWKSDTYGEWECEDFPAPK